MARIQALVLLLAWAPSVAWAVGHAVLHAHDAAEHHETTERASALARPGPGWLPAAGDRVVVDGEHGHDHPQDLAAARSQTLRGDTLALPVAQPRPRAPVPGLRPIGFPVAPARAGPDLRSPSIPRAPPHG